MQKSNQLAVIEKQLKSEDVTNRLILALNLNPQDETSRAKAFKYASSVLAEIAKTAGDEKRDLTVCTPDSICQAMIDAAQFQIAIDGRQHAHLVKYFNKAQLQIGFRGYISKISEYYRDADFVAEAIFKGDTLKLLDDGGFQTYTLQRGSVFNDSWEELQGVLVRIYYTKGNEKFQKVTTVSKNDLVKMRKAAKQDYIWSAWPIEKAKAAAIKRACKIQFADIMGLQEMIRYDNEANFDLKNQPAAPERRSIVDNINEAISPQSSPVNVTAEPEESPPLEGEILEGDFTVSHDDQLLSDARASAEQGVTKYMEFVQSLSDEDKNIVRTKNAEFSKIAKTADLKKSEQPPM